MPTGGESLEGAQWIKVDAPLGYKLNAAVFYPSTQGPFPIVLVLHGTGGFLARDARLGQIFAGAGFLTVAGAWFSGSGESSATYPTPIASPNGPPFTGANLDSIKYVKALINAAKTLPGADSRNVGLLGVSRGAIAALLVASTDGVQAVVADSGSGKVAAIAIDTSPMDVVETLTAPVLILHGTADQIVPVESIREYERTLIQWGKPYEAHYYEGAPHGVTLNTGTSVDALRRAATFFDKYLTSSASSRSGSPWLGAKITNITPELAQAMKLKPDQQGALITDISADGPADKAGLRSSDQIVTINGEETRVGGDIIIAINGQSIKSTNDVVAYLFGTEIGQTIILTVLRQGTEETISLTVGSRPGS